MHNRCLWPIGIILLGLLSGPSCEDDPTDLDYLKKTPAAGTASVAGIGGATATAAGSSTAAGGAGAAGN
jgi:hypothetical protein